MKTFYEQIPLDSSKTYIAREFKVDNFTFPFHYHPYFEINYIVKGSGKRIVGQKITEFSGNDITLIAPNLPHQFKNPENKKKQKIHSIILQFRPSLFGEDLMSKSEFASLVSLFQKARRGVAFGRNTIKKVDLKFRKLLNLKGFRGLMLFLEILNDLAETNDYEYLSDITWEEIAPGKGRELTERIFHYILNYYTDDLSLEKVAEVAGISKSAFSHYFKKRTGKTFSSFINELRVSHASRLLRETEKNVAEVCFDSGFNNLAYFNRVFKNIQVVSPRDYRKKYVNFT